MSQELLYPHEAARVFVRPDESYAWDTANSRWLSKYPKQVRECNDYLRFRMTMVTPARYAWVHARDLTMRILDTDRNQYVTITRVPEKYWRAPLVPQDRYFLCCLEPITKQQHALRVQRVELIDGVDPQPWSYNGRHARTAEGQLPTLQMTAEAAWHITENFRMNQAQFADLLRQTELPDRTPKVAQHAADEAIDRFRIPSFLQSFVNTPGTQQNRASLEAAGIPESPIVKSTTITKDSQG